MHGEYLQATGAISVTLPFLFLLDESKLTENFMEAVLSSMQIQASTLFWFSFGSYSVLGSLFPYRNIQAGYGRQSE